MLETSPKFKELVILVQSLHFILEEMETWGTHVTIAKLKSKWAMQLTLVYSLGLCLISCLISVYSHSRWYLFCPPDIFILPD